MILELGRSVPSRRSTLPVCCCCATAVTTQTSERRSAFITTSLIARRLRLKLRREAIFYLPYFGSAASAVSSREGEDLLDFGRNPSSSIVQDIQARMMNASIAPLIGAKIIPAPIATARPFIPPEPSPRKQPKTKIQTVHLSHVFQYGFFCV